MSGRVGMGWWHLHGPNRPMTRAEALAVDCPTCGRDADAPCVKMLGQTPALDQPIEKPHGTRYQLARQPSRKNAALLRALQDYDRREYAQLRAWLADNGRIFRTPFPAVVRESRQPPGDSDPTGQHPACTCETCP